MRSGLMIKLREETGVAMLVVLFAVVVVTVMGGALVVSGVRDLDSSTSVQRSSTALGVAEAGAQHAIQQLRRNGPTGSAIAQCVQDKSSPGGWGQFMNPTDRLAPPFYDATDPNRLSTDPLSPPKNCGPYEGWVDVTGPGLKGRYTTYAVGTKAEELIKLPGRKVGSYRVLSTGFDRRDVPSRPGERTVEQSVRIETVDVPFALFAETFIDFNGTPKIQQESVYTGGDVVVRDKINFEPRNPVDPECYYPTGCDIFYGWDGVRCGASPSAPNKPCPVVVNAAGTISGKIPPGASKAIHGPPATQDCTFPYDRDKDGSLHAPWSAPQPGPPAFGAWSCTAGPNPNADISPPYNTSFFKPGGPDQGGDFPFNTTGPKPEVYEFLKQIAKSTNTYCKVLGPNPIQIQGTSTTGECPGINNFKNTIPPDEFFVIYVDAPDGADLAMKTGWGPQTDPPNVAAPCTGHFGIVVLQGSPNADIDWQNNEVWWGAAFVPDGSFIGSGVGGAGGGWFVGTVYANSMKFTGNLRFQLNDCWLDAVSSPAFYLVTRLRWHESDR